MRERVLTAVFAVLAGCGPGAGDAPGEAEPAAAEDALVSTLEAQVGPDSVVLTLSVANAGAVPAVLEFTSSQTHDFVVREAEGGADVWRWSAARSFVQGAMADTVAAGGTRAYRGVWEHGGRSGEYTVTGELTSTNQSLELTTRLSVPAR